MISDHLGEDTYSEMMEEEMYHQEYDSYPDDDIQTISSASSQSEEAFSVIKKKKKKKIGAKKKSDEIGYRKIKSKNGNVEYFSTSNIPGAKIRDPIHGRLIFDHTVGSSDEDLYYKVVYLANGSKNQVDHLYYDNPEQFESHMNCSISTENKQVWADKYQVALRRLEKST